MPDFNNAPAWVNWIAQDANGTWWGYSVEPLQQTYGWYENEVGRCIRLHSGEPDSDWRYSLRRIRTADHSRV
ncbi:MAG: hypothetical protein LJE74_08200 [Proteobacteria bacterium]|jgi:hypothetical protein|nr:hypothetical protein [Pseudomonadota bacterium]MCG6934946.1 hypothetical protein [Pseudomonadota bacterium]